LSKQIDQITNKSDKVYDGKALRSYQIRDVSLCNLARLIVPTAFMLQDTTVDVTSRGLCLLMYWLGVGCVLLVCGIAALRSTTRAQQPLVVLVLLAQVLHRQGAAVCIVMRSDAGSNSFKCPWKNLTSSAESNAKC